MCSCPNSLIRTECSLKTATIADKLNDTQFPASCSPRAARNANVWGFVPGIGSLCTVPGSSIGCGSAVGTSKLSAVPTIEPQAHRRIIIQFCRTFSTVPPVLKNYCTTQARAQSEIYDVRVPKFVATHALLSSSAEANTWSGGGRHLS